MEQKLVVVLKEVKGDYEFQFQMPVGASLGAAYDACVSVMQQIVQMSNDAVEKAKAQNQE